MKKRLLAVLLLIIALVLGMVSCGKVSTSNCDLGCDCDCGCDCSKTNGNKDNSADDFEFDSYKFDDDMYTNGNSGFYPSGLKPNGKPQASKRLIMGTGGSGGTYYAFGGVLSKYIEDETGIRCTAVESDGSAANIKGIATGDYQLGTVQSDVMDYAFNGTKTFKESGKIDSFRAIGALYPETIQLVTTDPDIKTVADLKGKAVSIGVPNSGVYFNAMDVLTAAGLTLEDINEVTQDFNASAESLTDGKIDAAFIVAGAPTTAITELATRNAATHLIPIDGEVAKKAMESCSFYTATVIPKGTYKGQEEDVTTLSVKATLIVSADIDEDTVYNITKTIFDNTDAIAKLHDKGKALDTKYATEGITVPFHAGAAKYFKEKGIEVKTK